MTPQDIATELALYMQENHGASFGGIGYSTTSADFALMVHGVTFAVSVSQVDTEGEDA